MRLRDWILLGLLLLWFAGAVILWLRAKKNHTCRNCGGCSQRSCDSCRKDR